MQGTSILIFLGLTVAVLGSGLVHRLAIGSCSNPNRGGKIWRMIQDHSPDHLIILGDVVYADYEAIGKVTPELPAKIDREYGILSRDKHWNNLLSSVPHWSITYDDHDYGNNNGDKTFIYREHALNAFREFAKNSFGEFDTYATNGVYSSKLVNVPAPNGNTFTYKVILMDSRSNKDPKGTPNGDFLGEEQWAWLTAELNDVTPDLIVLGSSIQVLSDDKIIEENWSEFPQARERLLRLVSAASLQTNVILLSGDVHRAEISHAKCSLSSGPVTSTDAKDAAKDASQRGLLSKMDIDLWELTSSGLSHTIRYYTVDSALTSRDDYEEPNNKPITVPVKPRNFILHYSDMIYQFAYPGYYRPDKHAHAYANVHFALVDIVSAPEAASGMQIEFRVISHANQEVIRHVLPLRTKDELRQAHRVDNETQEKSVAALSALLQQPKERSGVRVECVPHWGVVPLWRELLYRAVIAMAVLLLIVLPVLAVLWYVGAAVYYILRGAELVRRDEVEQRYQENKKER